MEKLEIQSTWKNKFSEISGNQRDKHRANYLHFDIKPNLLVACQKIFNPCYVKKHSFWPFIFYKAKAEKIKILSDLLSKHSLTLPPGLNNKDKLPKLVKDFLKSNPEVSKALISKKGNTHKYATWKLRPICYASHIDSLIYSYYSDLLSYSYEKLLLEKSLNNNVLAFRKSNNKSCNIDHSYKAFNDIIAFKNCVVLAFDVSSFFDILDHKILKNKWLEVLKQTDDINILPDDHFKVYKSLTSYSYVDRDEVYELLKISKNNSKKVSQQIETEIKYRTLQIDKTPITNKSRRVRLCSERSFRNLVKSKQLEVKKNRKKRGIPQGSPISGLLSNIYMIDFDIRLKQYIESHNGKYYRYCDDLLCIIPIKERNEIVKTALELETFVYFLSNDLKLEVNKKKTEKYAFMPENILNPKYSANKKSTSKNITNKISCAKIFQDELISSQLQYLGFKFNGNRITIRSSSIHRYQKKLKRGIKYHLRLKKKYDFNGRLKRSKIRKLYSHSGKNNFPAYAYRSAKIMKSASIKRQLKNHQSEINKQIVKISKRIKIEP